MASIVARHKHPINLAYVGKKALRMSFDIFNTGITHQCSMPFYGTLFSPISPLQLAISIDFKWENKATFNGPLLLN